jgi:hypothetical protein
MRLPRRASLTGASGTLRSSSSSASQSKSESVSELPPSVSSSTILLRLGVGSVVCLRATLCSSVRVVYAGAGGLRGSAPAKIVLERRLGNILELLLRDVVFLVWSQQDHHGSRQEVDKVFFVISITVRPGRSKILKMQGLGAIPLSTLHSQKLHDAFHSVE